MCLHPFVIPHPTNDSKHSMHRQDTQCMSEDLNTTWNPIKTVLGRSRVQDFFFSPGDPGMCDCRPPEKMGQN